MRRLRRLTMTVLILTLALSLPTHAAQTYSFGSILNSTSGKTAHWTTAIYGANIAWYPFETADYATPATDVEAAIVNYVYAHNTPSYVWWVDQDVYDDTPGPGYICTMEVQTKSASLTIELDHDPGTMCFGKFWTYNCADECVEDSVESYVDYTGITIPPNSHYIVAYQGIYPVEGTDGTYLFKVQKSS